MPHHYKTHLSLASFVHFPMLPTELRLEIWRLALCRPAVWAPMFYADNKGSGAATMVCQTKYLSPAPYTAGLSCREARSILLETHIYIEPQQIRGYDPAEKVPRGIWAHPDYTIVYYLHYFYWIEPYFWGQDLSMFKHIMMDLAGFESTNGDQSLVARVFPNARSLIFLNVQDFHDFVDWSKHTKTVTSELAAKYLAISEQEELATAEETVYWKPMREIVRSDYREGSQPQVYFVDSSANQQDFVSWYARETVRP